MASYTTNLNLKKPTTSEMYNVLDWNDNSDKIDTAYGNINSQITTATEITLTPASGITVPTGGIKCHKVGRVCFVTLNGLTFDGTGNYTISGLPNPISNVFAKAVSSNANTTAAIVGNYAYMNNGSTTMAISVSSGNTNPHYICFCYIIAA